MRCGLGAFSNPIMWRWGVRPGRPESVYKFVSGVPSEHTGQPWPTPTYYSYLWPSLWMGRNTFLLFRREQPNAARPERLKPLAKPLTPRTITSFSEAPQQGGLWPRRFAFWPQPICQEMRFLPLLSATCSMPPRLRPWPPWPMWRREMRSFPVG